MADITLDEAVKRNCEALIAGNYAQIFVDLAPEAVMKLSQAGPAQVGGPLPKLTSYEIVARGKKDDDDLYDVRFQGDVNFGVRAVWREIGGQWKLVDFEPYQWGDAPPAPPAAPA